MKKTEANVLQDAISLVEETLYRAKLQGKPFILGLLTETPDGLLNSVLRDNEDAFKELGAVLIDWRDDALRGKKMIAGEELLVSVRAV